MKKKTIIGMIASAALMAALALVPAPAALAAEVTDSVSAELEVEAAGAQTQQEEVSSFSVEAPVITGFSNTASGTKITWSKSAGAAKYRLYVKENGYWQKIAQTSDTSFEHTRLQSGRIYTYTVRCLDSANNFVSTYYDGTDNLFLAPPVITRLVSTVKGVEIRWGAISGARRYRVYRHTKNSSWENIGETGSAEFTDKSVSSGVEYTYTVRCVSSDSRRFTSYYNSGKTLAFVKAPVITNLSNTASGTKITWSKSAGAAKYRVYVRENNVWKKIAQTAATSFEHTGLQSGRTYTYTVRCLDSANNFVSDYYDGVGNLYLAPPVISSLTNTLQGVEIRWGALSGAQRYRVYRHTKDSSWENLGETDSTGFTDKSVSSGVDYTYTVRCVSSDSRRFTSYYNSGKAVAYVKAPKITSLYNIASGTEINWERCAGAAKYRVYVRENGGWKKIAQTSDTSFDYTGLKSGQKYTYTVRCLDDANNFVSDYYDGTDNVYYAPPAISSVSKANGGTLIEWKDVNGASGYRLYRRTADSGWQRLFNSTPGTSYLDTTADSNIAYAYTLRLVGSDGSIISYYLSDTLFYKDGLPANGRQKSGSLTFNFTNGRFVAGFQRNAGKLYYYNSRGELQKNDIVGSKQEGYYYADGNGVCCESEEIKLAAEFMANNCSGKTLREKMKSGFMYLAKNFPYNRTYDHPKTASDIPPLAIDMFKNRQGNCFRYAACFTCIARIAGYRARTVIGTAGGNPHGWTEVLVDGEWLICDPDAQIPGYGVPAYRAYMMKYHYWNLATYTRAELTISGGKAVWK